MSFLVYLCPTKPSSLSIMQISLLGKIIDLFFPRFCVECGNRLVGTEELLCASCLIGLPYTNTWSNPYENEMAKMFWGQIPIERCVALFHYHSHSLPSNIIYKLKYFNRPDVGIYIGRLIAQKGISMSPPQVSAIDTSSLFDGIDAIIPIPLSKNRRKQRGYNQSEMIAKGIQGITHLPIITDVVKRTTFKESQTHKNRWQRQENVEHVFQLTDHYHLGKTKHPISELAGKHLLIIDDVCTTGATIIACCQELKKIGNMKFSVATIGWAHD